MTTPDVTLLMTRPLSAAERFVSALPPEGQARVSVCYSPLMRIETVGAPPHYDGAAGVIFTSSNGVSAAGRAPATALACFCVGEATTRIARHMGWAAQNAGATADELIATLTLRNPAGPLLHLRGAHSRGDVAGNLSRAGIETREQVVYDQKLQPLSEAALAALAGTAPVIVPLFSPRTARQFADQAQVRAPLWIAALSENVAEEAKSLKYNTLETCSTPDAPAMAGLVVDMLNRLTRVESGADSH